MFKGPRKIVRDNKSSSYPVLELTGVNCILQCQFHSISDSARFKIVNLLVMTHHILK